MKKIFTFIIATVCLIGACKKDKTPTPAPPKPAPVVYPYTDSITGNFYEHFDNEFDGGGNFGTKGNHTFGGAANTSNITYVRTDSVLINMAGDEGFSRSWTGKLDSLGNFSSYDESTHIKITTDSISYYYYTGDFYDADDLENFDTILFRGKIVHK